MRELLVLSVSALLLLGGCAMLTGEAAVARPEASGAVFERTVETSSGLQGAFALARATARRDCQSGVLSTDLVGDIPKPRPLEPNNAIYRFSISCR